jgi:hypothetical protein
MLADFNSQESAISVASWGDLESLRALPTRNLAQ